MLVNNAISQNQNKTIFLIFAILTVVSCWLSAALESFYPFAMPAFAVLIYVTVVDFRNIFYLLLACIPISTEFELPNGYATDLPTEPLIVGLMLIYWLFALKKGVILRGGAFFRHPITLLVLLHLGWILVSVINSASIFFSIKFLLAKIWYIVTFYFLAANILQEKKDFVRFFWTIFIPLSIALVITLARHAALGFSFDLVNRVMWPMFRNHVVYGCIAVLFLPFLFMGLKWQQRGSFRWWLILISIFIFLMAIQFSYVRAAYVAIAGAIGYYFVIKFRLTKYLVAGICIASIIFVAFIINNNKYLDYAPKYERAITHHSFDNLLEATAKGEDVSTMERVYRWVAGFQMVADKPITGFGPNNFFSFYKSYTVTRFKTYVSENEEKSTVHCYYLLVAIEQGIPGALIFLGLIFFVLLRGEKVYHQSWGYQRDMTMAVLCSFTILLILLLINDLIETDKFGSFFFMSLAMLTNLDLSSRPEEE